MFHDGSTSSRSSRTRPKIRAWRSFRSIGEQSTEVLQAASGTGGFVPIIFFADGHILASRMDTARST